MSLHVELMKTEAASAADGAPGGMDVNVTGNECLMNVFS
jgi:hypothetical protein